MIFVQLVWKFCKSVKYVHVSNLFSHRPLTYSFYFINIVILIIPTEWIFTQIKGYPTLKLFSNGVYVEDYKGFRKFASLHKYLTKRMQKQEHDEL